MLGQRIRTQRLRIGLSQEEMASHAGVHRTYYGAIERGERNLSLSSLLRIAHAQGIDPGLLIEGL
ncbi:helix-turn-helix domain-containing protein [Streptomyces viridochromogenes]|uniref:helix-turn-helix domain-containing protein n=1 Tax=Streptomyces viridochromogenes TaxID=1938 RepID=UPI00211ABA3F|nr:helix-turn-helix transcriptional regulator [Streptomyces viridochromogenes]